MTKMAGRGVDMGCLAQGAGAILVTIFLALSIWCWADPGDVITWWAACGYNEQPGGIQVIHTNQFITNGRPECFVCSGNVPMPGQRIKWLQFGKQMHGVWLKGHQIGMPDGTIVSDSCLPRLVNSVGDNLTPVDSGAQPPGPPDSAGVTK